MTTAADQAAGAVAHRQGHFTVHVRDRAGRPLAGATLSAEQTRHAFGVGMAVAERLLLSDGDDSRRYQQFIAERCNMLVCENAMKWYGTERDEGKVTFEGADATVAYARAHGMRLRGHCLIWEKTEFTQKWIQALPAAEIRRRMVAHLDLLATRYRGQVISWDVNNEMLDGDFYQSRFGRDVWVEMFQRAHAADPGALLFVNEYGILDSDEKTERYVELINYLRAHGAPVGGIGVQEHGAERYAPANGAAASETEARAERTGAARIEAADAYRRLDKLAAFGLPIHLTEISVKTPDRQRQAAALEAFFALGYAHPAVQAILLWGFWEKAHWLGPDAALVDKDWHPHPAAGRLDELLARWRTSATTTSDAAGNAQFRGTFGTYRLTARLANGTSHSASATLDAQSPTAELVVTP